MKYSLTTKYAPYLILAATLLLSSAFVFAQEPASITGEAPQTNTQQNEEVRGAAREERRVALETRFQERIVNLSANVTKRITAGTDRMTNITLRIDSRIQKLKAQGVGTGAVEAKFSEAKNALTATHEAIAKFGSAQAAIGSETPKESFSVIRGQFSDARAALKNTHTLLRETIALLKAAVAANEATTGVSDAVRAEPESTQENRASDAD